MNIIEKVYVETSVVGAYFEERTDVVSMAQNFWTRKWWDELRQQYFRQKFLRAKTFA